MIADIVPVLEPLCFHRNLEIAQLANAVKLRIESKDSQWTSQTFTKGTQRILLIYVKDKQKVEIQELLTDLQSPLIPIRASALVGLRKLVLMVSIQLISHSLTARSDSGEKLGQNS